MPEGAPLKNVDQSIFEDAVAEVRRLETLITKKGEAPPVSSEPVFEEKDSAKVSITDYEKALAEALKAERGFKPAPGAAHGWAPSAATHAYADEKSRREQDELRKMQEKFKKLEAEGKTSPMLLLKSTEARLPSVPPSPAMMTHASEEERLRVMREKLSGLVKRKRIPAAAAPAAVQPALPAVQPAQAEAEGPETRARELKERLAKKVREIKERERKDKKDEG